MEHTKLIHFSAVPLGPIRSIQQPARMAMKPAGLWISVEGGDDGWRQWCEGEKFGLHALAVETEIVLSPKTNVLRLSSADDIDRFTEEYRRPNEERFSFRLIDWRRVARRYQGIIIAPYVWERRLHDDTSWYYGWDCASGCIWDAEAICEARQLVPVESEA